MFDDLNSMFIDDFKKIPLIENDNVPVDSFIFVPSFIVHDSGFAYYHIIACNRGKCVGRLPLTDTFSIYMKSSFNRVGIDCLANSGCIRVFLPPGEYLLVSFFFQCKHISEKW